MAAAPVSKVDVFPDIPLNGKILLITGGGSGIGLCLTQQCLDLGAKVLIADLKLTADAEKLVNENKDVIFQKTDVTNWKQLHALFQASEKYFGDYPDAYGICAGLFDPPFSNFWHDPEDDRYLQVDVNVSAPIKLTRLAIKYSLRKNKKATVCIIASIAGIAGNIAAPLYCATKHAIVGFVKSLKGSESFTGVKVTTILPGLVNTPLITSDKATQFTFVEKNALTPDAVATGMTLLIQESKYPCGTIMEISTNGNRVLPEWNIPAPTAEGSGQEFEGDKQAIDRMISPILKTLDGERAKL